MRNRTHGTGAFDPSNLAAAGPDCVFETGVLIFHPENVYLGANVYVGHYAILKGYYKNRLEIGDESWIGQQCFLHSAGGLRIGRQVGIGPGVKILTSQHTEAGRAIPIYNAPVEFKPVVIEDGADIGAGAVLLPGITVGKGAQVGAGAVVTRDIPAYTIAAGSPAKVMRARP
jgi:acetyltransferase-like isoleucine patch superfamily enzyme